MKSPTNHYITGFKKERPTNTSPTGLDSPRFSWNIKFSCRSQGQCVGTSRFTRWHTRRVRLRDAHTHALARCGAGTITGREGGGGMADIRLVIVMLDGWTLCLDLRYCNKYCSIKNKVLNSHRCHSNMCIYIYSSIYIYTHFFDTLYVQTLYLHFIIWCLHFVHVATLWLPKLTYVFLLHFGQRFTSGTLNQSHGAAVALCFMYNEDSKFPARDVAHRFKQFRLEVWNMMKAVWNAFWSDKVTSRHLPFVGVLLY